MEDSEKSKAPEETSGHQHLHHRHHRHHTPFSEEYHQILSDRPAAKMQAGESTKTERSTEAVADEDLSNELDRRIISDSDESEQTAEHHHHHHSHHEELTPEEQKQRDKEKKKLAKRANRKRITPIKVLLIILIIVFVLMLGVLVSFLVLAHIGKKDLEKNVVEVETIAAPEEAEEVEDDGKTIVYKGEKYCYNTDNITILCLGTDKSKNDTDPAEVGENGQADAVFLAVIDKNTGDLSIVAINRDCIADVERYDVNGNYYDTTKTQICLAYAYGDGGDGSAQNMAKSVSRLLKGMPINGYAAIDYTGVSALNDAIGGVTVDVLEDLTYSDPIFEVGKTLTLEGHQAITYIRSRGGDVDSATRRLQRQKQYLTAFLQKTLSTVKSDPGIVFSLYQTASDYMVTDISLSEVTYLASLAAQKGFNASDIQSVPGEITLGEDGYAEFIPDEEGIYELVLSVFYTKQ